MHVADLPAMCAIIRTIEEVNFQVPLKNSISNF